VLHPRNTWSDPAAYDTMARKLAHMFEANFAQYADGVSPAIRSAGPVVVDGVGADLGLSGPFEG
jgi:phosphoenolpyruvate carboxykinase (ATP)